MASGNGSRADDDDRAVDVEDQQGLDLARFVERPAKHPVHAVLPASERREHPRTRIRLLAQYAMVSQSEMSAGTVRWNVLPA